MTGATREPSVGCGFAGLAGVDTALVDAGARAHAESAARNATDTIDRLVIGGVGGFDGGCSLQATKYAAPAQSGGGELRSCGIHEAVQY